MDSPARLRDRTLAERSVGGDREAQRAIFHAHKSRVHHVLYRILGSNREMEDIAQEAFVEIFRSLAQFRGDATLATWIDRITTRVAYHHLRRGPRPVRLEAIREPASDDDPESQVALAEISRRLYAILDELSPEQRIAYALHVLDGRALSEVGRLVGVSVLAVKSRVWRAQRYVTRRALRDPTLRSFLEGRS
jgi:RNA polymerase sigma-70 factor (ECF subfamily)